MFHQQNQPTVQEKMQVGSQEGSDRDIIIILLTFERGTAFNYWVLIPFVKFTSIPTYYP